MTLFFLKNHLRESRRRGAASREHARSCARAGLQVPRRPQLPALCLTRGKRCTVTGGGSARRVLGSSAPGRTQNTRAVGRADAGPGDADAAQSSLSQAQFFEVCVLSQKLTQV